LLNKELAMAKNPSDPLRIGPKSFGPNRGQKRRDWTLESRKTKRPLKGAGGALLVYVTRGQAQAALKQMAECGPHAILLAGMLRVAKLTREHRAHAYKGRFA
jgi:hypothetical protein